MNLRYRTGLDRNGPVGFRGQPRSLASAASSRQSTSSTRVMLISQHLLSRRSLPFVSAFTRLMIDRSFPPPLIRPRDLNSIARCSYGLERRDRVDRTSTPGVSSDSSDSSRLVRAALTVMSAALTVFLRLNRCRNGERSAEEVALAASRSTVRSTIISNSIAPPGTPGPHNRGTLVIK